MAQLSSVVERDCLFRSYWYRSGMNDTMRKHLEALAAEAALVRFPRPSECVLDIGANDGTLLSFFPRQTTVGFDPALNLLPDLATHATHAVGNYFTVASFEKLDVGKAALVFTLSMFYDLLSPAAFCRDIARVLAPDGVWVCEMNYFGEAVRTGAYDFIGHEHVGNYFLAPFNHVVRQAGLEIFHVEGNTLNGGSMRAWLCHKGSRPTSASVDRFLAREGPYRTAEALAEYAMRAKVAMETLRETIGELAAQGKTIWAYGASTRGMTTLQASRLTASEIVAVADKNLLKVGRYLAGLNIPIRSEDEMRQAQPHYLLILPWGYLPEFRKREVEYLAKGGHFIIPMPTVEVL